MPTGDAASPPSTLPPSPAQPSAASGGPAAGSGGPHDDERRLRARLRPGPLRVIIATTAALIALVAARTFVLAPTADASEGMVQAEAPDPLAQLLVDDHARERRDQQSALRALTELRIGAQALALTRKRYVQPEKIRPAEMLQSALRALSHAVPPMLLQGDDTAITVIVGESRLTLPLAEVTDLFRLDRVLLSAMRFLAPRLSADAPAADFEYIAINGALQTLDPYSRMLDPDAWREMRTHTGGQFGGLGIRILVVEGVLTVVGVIEGSPAAKVGLAEKDQILQIDGEDTLNMSVDDAVARLRGDVGATAVLLVRREGWAKPREVPVVRAIIQLSSVEGRVLDNGVAYAKIKGFQRGTGAELAAFVQGLQQDNRGLVLDLRGNPGGLLEEAVAVVSVFVDRGVVVSTVGAGRAPDARPARAGGVGLDIPLVLLVDRRSASASEIVAGALKHANRALLIGERTFGKGTVQVPFEIGDGALKLTIAQYLVGGEVVIQGRGVVPDVAVDFASVLRDRVSLFDPTTAKRRAEAEAQGMRPSHRLRVLVPIASERRSDEQASPGLFRDGEPIRRAAEILRRAGDVTASGILQRLPPVLAELKQADDAAIAVALTRVGVDWRVGPRDPEPKVTVQIDQKGQEFLVEAGGALAVHVTVSNKGSRPLHRVHLQTECDADAFDGVEAVVGKLGAGQSRAVTLRLRPSRRHLDAIVPVRVVALADGVALGATSEVSVTVVGRPRPTLSFRYALLDPGGRKIALGEVPTPAVLRPGQAALLRVEVRNEGPGPSRRTTVTLRSLAGAHLRLDEGKADLGRLDPGEIAVAMLAVHGGQRGSEASGLLEARVQMTDDSSGWTRQSRIYLPWEPGADRPLAPEAARVADAEARRWNRPPALRLLGDEDDIDAPLAEASTPSALDAAAVDDDRVDASPEAGRLAPLRMPCVLPLRAAARFEADGPAQRYVTISVEGRKRSYHDGRGRTRLALEERIELQPGLSRVTILAQAGGDRVASRALLVHCAAQAEPSAPSAQTSPPNGASARDERGSR